MSQLFSGFQKHPCSPFFVVTAPLKMVLFSGTFFLLPPFLGAPLEMVQAPKRVPFLFQGH